MIRIRITRNQACSAKRNHVRGFGDDDPARHPPREDPYRQLERPLVIHAHLQIYLQCRFDFESNRNYL